MTSHGDLERPVAFVGSLLVVWLPATLAGPRMVTVGLAWASFARLTFLSQPRRLGAAERARGCRPGLKITPQTKHMYAKEKRGINSLLLPCAQSLALYYLSFRQRTSGPHFKAFWESVPCRPNQLPAFQFHYPQQKENFYF